MDQMIAELRKKGSATLDVMSFQLAVDVAAEIVGLTQQDSRRLAQRMRRTLDSTLIEITSPGKRLANGVRIAFHMWNFYRKDLAPAVRARRAKDHDDVIGYMVRHNYSTKAMIIECLTYAGAGMLTTREFIVVCAWHLFDNTPLRERFLEGDEREQFAILYEILRLEPVAAMLYRHNAHAQGEVFALDIRAANTDEMTTGACPFSLDPGRAKRMKVEPSFMSFGDGHHRCPGAQVALHETRFFLDALLRVPGIHLANPPEVLWNSTIGSYELRGAIVACSPPG
jgi:cytochrome P450